MSYIIKPSQTDYTTNIRYIEELIKEFPFLNAEIIGRSAPGRCIFSLTLGKNSNRSVLVGSLNGADRLSGLLLMHFTENLCRALKYGRELCSVDIRRAFSQLGVTVVPFPNPDGCEISSKGFEGAKGLRGFVRSLSDGDHSKWDFNASGVDLTLNFAACEKLTVKEKIHSGSYAESESETRALTRLCRMSGFRQCLNLVSSKEALCLHSSENTAASADMMAKILADSCSYPYYHSNEKGFCEWFSQELHKPAFTMKTGKGDAPLPENNLYKIYERIEEALLLFTLM